MDYYLHCLGVPNFGKAFYRVSVEWMYCGFCFQLARSCGSVCSVRGEHHRRPTKQHSL